MYVYQNQSLYHYGKCFILNTYHLSLFQINFIVLQFAPLMGREEYMCVCVCVCIIISISSLIIL